MAARIRAALTLRIDLQGALVRVMTVVVLAAWLTFAAPGAVHVAHAAPLEDCDGDGFDDATGVPVPWPGYDETHGDTPAGPGTADWWIEQNGGSSGSGSDSGGSTDPGPTDSGGSSANPGTGGTVNGSAPNPSSGGTGAQGGSSSVQPGADDPAVAPAVAATLAATATAAATSTPVTATPIAAQVASAAIGSDESTAVAEGGSSLGAPRGLWGALTAGLTGDRDELLAGLSLLGILAIAGALAVVRATLTDWVRNAHLRRSDAGHRLRGT